MFSLLTLFQIALLAVRVAADVPEVPYVFFCTGSTLATQIYFGECGYESTVTIPAPTDNVVLVTPNTVVSTVMWDLSTPSVDVESLSRTETGVPFSMDWDYNTCGGDETYTVNLNYYCWTAEETFYVVDIYSTVYVPSVAAPSTITMDPSTVTVDVTVDGAPVTVTVDGAPVTVTVDDAPVTVTVDASPVTVTVDGEGLETTTTEYVTIAATSISTILESFCPGSDGTVTYYTTGPIAGTSTVTTCNLSP